MKKQILAACMFGALALPAAAEGIYVLGDVGQTKFSGEGLKETSTGFSIGAGYKINNGFSVEAAYRDLGNISSSYIDAYPDFDVTIDADFDFSALQLSLVGTVPFTDKFSAYARLGYAKIQYDLDVNYSAVIDGSLETASESDSDSAYKAVYGLGARYALNDQIGLRVEYNDIAEWDGLEVSAVTIGADYTF